MILPSLVGLEGKHFWDKEKKEGKLVNTLYRVLCRRSSIYKDSKFEAVSDKKICSGMARTESIMCRLFSRLWNRLFVTDFVALRITEASAWLYSKNSHINHSLRTGCLLERFLNSVHLVWKECKMKLLSCKRMGLILGYISTHAETLLPSLNVGKETKYSVQRIWVWH